MTRTFKTSKFALQLSLFAVFLFVVSLTSYGQAPARFIGAITGISGASLTVKTDAGQSYQVEVPATAVIKRISPGEKDLSKADAMQFADLAVADRVLVKLDPDAAAGTTQAIQIIAIKQADVAKKQQQDRED